MSVSTCAEESPSQGLEPKPASLWWSSMHDGEIKEGLKVNAAGVEWSFPFQESYMGLGHLFHKSVESQECMQERVTKATKAWFTDAHIFTRGTVGFET